VPVERIELPTFGLQNRCSTAELNRRIERASGPTTSPDCADLAAERIPDLSEKGQHPEPAAGRISAHKKGRLPPALFALAN
jgi:hypothetical protein